MNNIDIINHTMQALTRYRPNYDNRHIGDYDQWEVDNAAECEKLYHSCEHERPFNWDLAKDKFIQCEYYSVVKNAEWHNKHEGEYRDTANKERNDRIAANRNEFD